MLRESAALSATAIPIAAGLSLQHSVASRQAQAAPAPSQLPPPRYLSPRDDSFLEELEKAIFQYFWEQTNPDTGLVKDRCNVRSPDNDVVGSIAATGFGLTALCIGDKRGYISYTQARDRVLNTLRFLWKKLPNQRGFFYHWANINTGERLWDSEISSIDTAILLCGVLTCRDTFRRTPRSAISRTGNLQSRGLEVALRRYARSCRTAGRPKPDFCRYRWDSYSEMMMIYLLGLGSTTHPLPADTWDAWKRTTFEYDGIKYIGSFAPLFVHQYSQAWFDFRGKRDQYADYFQNSVLATEVHRRFCLDLSQASFRITAMTLWGITASDSHQGLPSVGWAAGNGAD